jgi:ABC-2 type transport system ATP-binding protein
LSRQGIARAEPAALPEAARSVPPATCRRPSPPAPAVTVRPAVEVVDLHVTRRRRPVLRDLTFEVPAGTVTGLLGPSGSGKTTLLRCVVGAQRVTGGQVRVLGEPAGAAGLRSRVGYVTQEPAVYADLDVLGNLRYFGRVLAAPPGRVEEVLERVRLTEHVRTVAGLLSTGERSRLALATALVGDPEVLVLDEPTVGLDPVLRQELWELFHELAARGTTVLVSSHVMDEAARCARLLVLREGVLIADDTPAGLRAANCTGDLEEAFLRMVRERDEDDYRLLD